MDLKCYYDFTCGYSYRAWSWLQTLKVQDPEIEVDWLPFLLKEVNRAAAEVSVLAGSTIESLAVLALAAAEALRGEPGADVYRKDLFHAMHDGGERPSRDDVMRIARRAGLDTDAFVRDEATWLEAVRQSHERGLSDWGVFGTPTLVLAGTSPMYLKLAAVPADGASALWDAVRSITVTFPEVAELKRPLSPVADPIRA